MSMFCLAGLLSACSVVPTNIAPAQWTPSLQRMGSDAFEHLTCGVDGLGGILLGALEGSLEGTAMAMALALTDQVAADQTIEAQADDVMLALIGTGAVLGLGAGIGEKILDLPASYKDCLDRQEALREKITT